MASIARSLLVFLVAALVAVPAAAEPVKYEIQAKKSKLVVHLLKEGLASAAAHDHVIRAGDLSGVITADSDKPASSSIYVSVPTKSLVADEPPLRRRYGMTKPLSAEDRAEIQQSMRSRDQLWVDRHKSITFRSRRITPLPQEDRYRVEGNLTIRGVTRSVTLPVKATVTGNTIRASGNLKFRQSEFGYEPYSAAGGLVKVKDEATLNIYLEATAS